LEDAQLSQEPAVVAVQAQRDAEAKLCSGVLLLENLVLTARHCVTLDRKALETANCKDGSIAMPDDKTRITVTFATDIALASPDEVRGVREVWLPQDEAKLCGQDLALLLLDSPVARSPLSLTEIAPKADAQFVTYGFGLADGDYGRQRKTDQAHLVCLGNACKDDRLVDNEFFANTGACEGDSGGPAVNDKGQVFAIASRSTADCSKTTYVTFSQHLDWLRNAAQQAAQEGKVNVPDWAKAPTVVPSTEPKHNEQTSSTKRKSPAPLRVTGGGCEVAPRSHKGCEWGACLALFIVTIARRGARRFTGFNPLCKGE
jgi:hypothetical protein